MIKNFWSALKSSVFISLLSIGIGSIVFSIIDYVELFIIYGGNHSPFFNFPEWVYGMCLYSYIILSIPAIIGGSLISAYSQKTISDNPNISANLTMKRGAVVAAMCTLFMIVPVLVLFHSLVDYQIDKLIWGQLYINPYIRAFEAILISGAVGAYAGRKIHANNAKRVRDKLRI